MLMLAVGKFGRGAVAACIFALGVFSIPNKNVVWSAYAQNTAPKVTTFTCGMPTSPDALTFRFTQKEAPSSLGQLDILAKVPVKKGKVTSVRMVRRSYQAVVEQTFGVQPYVSESAFKQQGDPLSPIASIRYDWLAMTINASLSPSILPAFVQKAFGTDALVCNDPLGVATQDNRRIVLYRVLMRVMRSTAIAFEAYFTDHDEYPNCSVNTSACLDMLAKNYGGARDELVDMKFTLAQDGGSYSIIGSHKADPAVTRIFNPDTGFLETK